MSEKIFYTVNELAKLLNVTNRTIYNYIKAGKIKSTEIIDVLGRTNGRKIMVSPKFVMRFFGEKIDFNKSKKKGSNGFNEVRELNRKQK